MTKCKNARRYKAIRAPKCGCDCCEIRWQVKVIKTCVADIMKAIQDLYDDESIKSA